MIRLRMLAVLPLLAALPATGCSLRLLDRWDGRLVRTERLEERPQYVWTDLAANARSAGLLIALEDPRARVLEFSWLPAPGDGREYLRCDAGPVGSASLRPRIEVVASRGGSVLEISSLTHATAGRDCVSTGRFEAWLLERLQPAGQRGRIASTPTSPQ